MEIRQNRFAWNDFSIGFWHTFGSHGGESPTDILARKEAEVSNNSWTLWSFQSSDSETSPSLERWFDAINEVNPESVFVFCSNSPTAKDPDQHGTATHDMSSYCEAGSRTWDPIPQTIRVPHPIKNRQYASAFKVKRVIRSHNLLGQPDFSIEWQAASGLWRSDRLAGGLHYPNRGEYLIRRGGNAYLRPVLAVLELDYPYLATLRK